MPISDDIIKVLHGPDIYSISILEICNSSGKPIDKNIIAIERALKNNMPNDSAIFESGFERLTPDPVRPGMFISEFVPDIRFIKKCDPPCKLSKLRGLAELHKNKMLGCSEKERRQ